MKKKKKQEKQKISTTPVLIEHNGRAYLGCARCNQRMEVSVCDSRRCSKRKKCAVYLYAKDMKQEWLEEHPQAIVAPVRKRRRKRNVEEVPVKKRTRKRKTQETPVKRKRKRKETEQPLKRKRKRKR